MRRRCYAGSCLVLRNSRQCSLEHVLKEIIVAAILPLACGAELPIEQFAALLKPPSEREHLSQLLAGVRSVVDSFEVDPYLWRVRLSPPIDCSLELFFKSGCDLAGWRSPAAPKDAQEEIAGIDILVDLGLWSAVSGNTAVQISSDDTLLDWLSP